MSPQQSPGPPPSRECPLSREFEVHAPHTWNKPNRPRWKYHCDGILPVEKQPPCQVRVSDTQPECGKPAPSTVRIRTKTIDVVVDVCAEHRRAHDNKSARVRAEHRQTLPEAS